MLFDDEYAKIKKKLPKHLQGNLKHFGSKLFIIPKPCPFLNQNKCAIYKDRPLVCRAYPYTLYQNAFAYTQECLQHSILDDNGSINGLFVVLKIIFKMQETAKILSRQQNHLLEQYLIESENNTLQDSEASPVIQILPENAMRLIIELNENIESKESQSNIVRAFSKYK